MKNNKRISNHAVFRENVSFNTGRWKASSFLMHWKFCLLIAFILFSTISVHAQKQLEDLGRGVVAVRTSSNQVFVSWRLLGTEPTDLGFNLYRGSTKVNATPIIASTNYVDNTSSNELYTIRAVIDGVEQEASAPATVWAQQYLSIPLQRPAGGTTPAGESYDYQANDASVGDLDGDGEYEIILKWNPSNAKDNSQQGYTGNVYLDAYKLDGTRLWRIDLGRNIRAGAHYTQFIVYDLDSDGKAELAVKTAPNTKDGTGSYLSMGPAANDDDNADFRTGGNWAGFIIDGPEYLTIFNGETGAEMATTNYIPNRYPTDGWGKWGDHTNRVDRFLAGVGYFDGEKPSLLMTRGYYGRSVLVAWDWRNGQLTQRWKFDTNDPGKGAYAGQGYHSLSINDVDGDGKDEVIFGSMAVDDDGRGLYNTGLGHGDAQHVGDLVPDRPGLESWSAHECVPCYQGNGLWLRDAGTGEKLWGVPADFDVGRALSADIDPSYAGNEMWGAAGDLYSSRGEYISSNKPSMNFAIWWDGDLLREILDGDKMEKWNYNTNSVDRIFTIYQTGAAKINGTKSNANLTADILGDWREEIILRNGNNTELMVFTTTIPTTHKIHTLMHDPQYRVAVAWQNVAYNQPPHTSFFIGANMNAPLTMADNPADFIIANATEGVDFNDNAPSLADAFGTEAGANLVFSKNIGPDWLKVAADGTFSGIPTDSDAGENTFTVQVADGGVVTDLRILKVNVENVNMPPVWMAETITKSTALIGGNYNSSLAENVTDPDNGDAVASFVKVSGPDWLTIAANGSLTGTPLQSDLGENTFVIRATDTNGASSEATVIIIVDQASLVNHYHFEGNAEDSEGGKHGTTVGSPAYQEGLIGNAIKLDGSDDYIDLPDGIVNYQQLTVASWVKWNGGNNWQRIFDFGNDQSSYMFLTPKSASGNLRFAIRTAEEGEQRIDAPILATGEWKHVAVTIEGSTAKLYVDGVKVGENTGMTLLPGSMGNTVNNFIGKSQWPDPLLNGQLDDFRIYNYVLNASEIEELTTITVNKAPQSITFNPIDPKRVGDPDFDPAATASSGLAVTYTSSNTEVATVVNGKIHIVGPGTTTITAVQEGSEEYEAAEPATQQLVVEEVTSIPGVSASGPRISVYPNPSSGSYTLELNDFKPGKVVLSVVDGNGKQILQKAIEVTNSRQSSRFSLDGFASGFYFLQLKGGDTVTAIKISLQR